jgi:hypothetical protein
LGVGLKKNQKKTNVLTPKSHNSSTENSVSWLVFSPDGNGASGKERGTDRKKNVLESTNRASERHKEKKKEG